MTTFAQIQAELDQHTLDELSPVPLIFGNTVNNELNAGSVPYISQRVILTDSRQFELGSRSTETSRNWGKILFMLHVRKGTGDGDRNILQEAVITSFRSRVVGRATLQNARVIGQGENQNWNLTAIEVPFYYDKM